MKYTLLLAVLLLTACSNATSTLRRADAAMALGEYQEAANLYRRAYQQTPVTDKAARGAIAYQQADAYRRFGSTARARGALQTAERLGCVDTLTLLYLGDMLRYSGEYRAAAEKYDAYLQQHPGDVRATRGREAALTAQEIVEHGSAYEVSLERLMNSARADYAPAYQDAEGQVLYFSSTRMQAAGDLSAITGMKNGDIYCCKRDEKGAFRAPEPVEGELNTANDEGATAFSPDGQTMYLTVCPVDAQYPRGAEIWTSTRGDAKWGKPTRLTITADTLSSYAHPAVSPDGRYLYFTSDMPGGYGGYDLWRVALTPGHGVGAVENLGPDINSDGDEEFPAFRPSGELYFSSNGRLPNLGGLDIYRATEDTLTGHWNVTALPAPMNSAGDDFGITFEGLHHRGFFSSNRSTGGRGWDKIYRFSYPEVLQTVKGWVYEQDGYELPAATVVMVGDDGTYVKTGVTSDGSFEQPVTAGVHYLLLASCSGYLNVRAELVPDTVEREKQYVLQFPLPSISIPVLVRGISYDFNSAALTDTSGAALDRLVRVLAEHPYITIELAAHCDYRGSDEYNLRLSQARAESVVRYLTSHGVAADRLVARGYGEGQPKVVTRRLAETYPFLHENDTLTEAFIRQLTPEQQEVANALNRRTEFRVLRTTYGSGVGEGLLPQAP